MRLLTILLFLASLSAALEARAQVRGEPAAVMAAERLLESAGGRRPWAEARRFYVEERVFLESGEVAMLRIWRDLVTGARRLEREAPGLRFVEWLAADSGWDERNGIRREMAAEELAMEREGLRQEPYAIYRRIALRDPGLRVALREENRLYVHDRDERLLCWFVLDGTGAPISWGNFWNGAINQHYYGPIADLGDVRLPEWGVSATGTFRFEYVRAVLDRERVEPPPPSTR